MKRRILLTLLSVFAILVTLVSYAAPKGQVFSFTVIGQNASRDDTTLFESIKRVNQSKSLFGVINGVKSQGEPCSDSVLQRRRKLLDESEKPIIVSLAARDWAECNSENGESSAQERLNFVRGMLFENDHSVGTNKIQIARQSSAAKFRNYSENARWEMGGILFVTVNLPANNNHYLAAAGRNNEFEDRLIANLNWLQRVFIYAKSHKMKGIVLFVDGSPLAAPARSNRSDRRDGFAEIRKQLATLTAKFSGKVLLIHGQQSPDHIVWRDNLGVVGAGKSMLEVVVSPGASALFTVNQRSNARRRR